MEKQWVRTAFEKNNAGYYIKLGKDLVEMIGQEEISQAEKTSGFVLVTDEHVQKLYAAHIEDWEARAKKTARPFLTLVIPPGEDSKSLKRVEALAKALARQGFGRQTKILAFGGGVVGDLAGFLASVYMRGVEYVQIPTTLLAQVDSSIGGKTGVNLSEGKNLIGSFYPPAHVWIDGTYLQTLKQQDWINGYGELIKHGIIGDPLLFSEIEEKYQKGTLFSSDAKNLNEFTALIHRGVQVKKRVVEADERERGLRKILNFGHTVGHALEALYQYQGYSHGEAVLRGMIYEAEIARHQRRLPIEEFQRIRALIDGVLSFAEPRPLPEKTPEELIDFMKRDKKNRGKKLSFILPEKIGKAKEVLLAEDSVRNIFIGQKF